MSIKQLINDSSCCDYVILSLKGEVTKKIRQFKYIILYCNIYNLDFSPINQAQNYCCIKFLDKSILLFASIIIIIGKITIK